MKIKFFFLFFLFFLFILTTCIIDNISFPANIYSKLRDVISKPIIIYPLDTEKAAKQKELIRKWVSGSLDFSKAIKEPSKRFKRDVFIQKKKENNFDIQYTYREGQQYFKFRIQKEIEPTVLIESTFNKNAVIDNIKKFALDNSFIEEKNTDKIMLAVVENRMIDKAGITSNFIERRTVVLRREFEGKPVVNSFLSVKMLPESNEIMEFTHYNWTPLQKGVEIKLSGEKTGYRNALGLLRLIMDRIKYLMNDFEKATIDDFSIAWYQTEKFLVPVLVLQLTYEYKVNDKYEKSYFVDIINLSDKKGL